jgi:CO/xanthine dehydrogenase FAD-binding subunit
MKPAAFEYFAPRTIEEAISLLADHPDEAKLLAGGQSLVPLMNMRLARPRYVVDLNRIAELEYLREMDGELAIGAMTRQADVEQSAMAVQRHPLLREALELVGHPAIRNRGTIGGSLAHADPAAELPTVIVALDGRVVLRGPRAERTLAACDFFCGYLTTAAAPDEILTGVRLPRENVGTGSCFLEIARRHGDFALVAAAAVVRLDTHGACAEARIVLGGVGATPVRAERAEKLVEGRAGDPGLFAEAGRAVSDALHPESDLHATADYRRDVAGTLTRRTLERAWRRAIGEGVARA